MASTYDLVEYDSDEERQKNPQGPPRENLLAAATYITLLLGANEIDYAAMGGFAMICRGSTRNTSDVDVIVDTSFGRLWDVIRQQPRLKIPNRKLVEGVIKVFVATGPAQKDTECIENHWVEVDLLEPGFKGSPKKITEHQEQLTFQIGQQQRTFICLDVLYMVRSKIQHCVTRTLARDVQDVLYLLDNYGPEISHYRDKLNKGETDSFLQLPWTEQVVPQALTTYKLILGRP